MISSLTPSEKNCISGSVDKLSNGSTVRMGSALFGWAATIADGGKRKRLNQSPPSCRAAGSHAKPTAQQAARGSCAQPQPTPGPSRDHCAPSTARHVDAVAEEGA